MFYVYLAFQELTQKQCDKKFQKFMIKYQKQYYTTEEEQHAKQIFCKNYESYIRLKKLPKYTSIQLGINENFDHEKMGNVYTNYQIQGLSQDQQINELNNQIIQIKQAIGEADSNYADNNNYNRGNMVALDNCNQVPNYATSNSIILKKQLEDYICSEANLPNSVDIREWGLMNTIADQGSCGSCWAFTTRNVVDSLVLHDIKYYREIYNDSSLVQSWTSKTFRSSVQFVLNNSYGNNYMCGGGNFINAGVDVAYGYVQGIELNSVAPYVSFSSDDVAPDVPPTRIQLQTQEFIDQQLIPVHYFNSLTDCPSVLFGVSASSLSSGFGVEEDKVKMIKRLLATGMALSGRMHTEGSNNNDDTTAFQMYNGGVLDNAPCVVQSSNHQITMIGYGHMDGVPVWVFANSWGTSFGQQGSFYVKIGSNYLCTELDVYAMLPRFRGYDVVNEDPTVPFNQTQVFDDMFSQNILLNINENKIVRGINGMDDYDELGQPIRYKKNISIGFYIIIAILAIFVIIWLTFVIRCFCCPQRKQIKAPQYVVLTQQEKNNPEFFKGDCVQASL